MPTGNPSYPSAIDTDATLGPTSSIVPGTGGTVLGGAASGQGTILGITKNLINTLIGLETVVGIPTSAVSTTHSFKISTLQSQIVALPTTSLTGVVPPLPSTAAATKFLRGDATFAAIPPAITGVTGLVPIPPGTAATFLRGDATFAQVAYSDVTGPPSIPTVGTLTTSNSITGGGAMTGNLTIQLSGDSASPGNTMLYGTNGAGTKGWYAQPLGGSSTGADSITGTTTVTLVNDVVTPTNGQFYGYNGSARGWSTPPSATATVAGYVPTPPNNTTTFLRGDATFAQALSTKTYSVFTAMDASPPSTLYGVFGTRNFIPFIAFNDTTSWNTVFMGVIPEAAVLTSGLKVRIHWISASATTGNVMWRMYFERMNTNENSDSFDTVISASAAACNGTSGIITITETICTTIDSVTIGDGFRLKIDRDAANGSDTMAGDAQVILVEVRSAV